MFNFGDNSDGETKREAAITATERKLAEIKEEISIRKAKQISDGTKCEFEKKQEVLRAIGDSIEVELSADVAFLLDCSHGMHRHMGAAKENILQVISEVHKMYGIV